MLEMQREIGSMSEAWACECPHCMNVITWYVTSPVYCTSCHQELPNLDELTYSMGERLNYYYGKFI